MEKFVLTPIKIFDKIAKYSPENAKIELLAEADQEKERVENDNYLDPVTKTFLTNLKRKDVELYRKKVFPQDSAIHQPLNTTKQYEQKVAENSKEKDNKDNEKMDDENENLPPLNTSHTETLGPDQKYILSLLENDPTFELHEDQTYHLGKKRHRNIHETLNHITRSRTSQRLQPVDGTEVVLRSLGQNNDNLDLNKITLRQEMREKIKNYQAKAIKDDQIVSKTKGGAAPNKLIFIDKLPFNMS